MRVQQEPLPLEGVIGGPTAASEPPSASIAHKDGTATSRTRYQHLAPPASTQQRPPMSARPAPLAQSARLTAAWKDVCPEKLAMERHTPWRQSAPPATDAQMVTPLRSAMPAATPRRVRPLALNAMSVSSAQREITHRSSVPTATIRIRRDKPLAPSAPSTRSAPASPHHLSHVPRATTPSWQDPRPAPSAQPV